MTEVRKFTNHLLDLMDQGVLDPRMVADMALQWFSEDDIKGMCLNNDILIIDPDTEEDEE